VSVYRITVPGKAPSETARLVLDDTQCRSKKQLTNDKMLRDCARHVRMDSAKGGSCLYGGNYFNWEAQTQDGSGACSCCTQNFRADLLSKNPMIAF